MTEEQVSALSQNSLNNPARIKATDYLVESLKLIVTLSTILFGGLLAYSAKSSLLILGWSFYVSLMGFLLSAITSIVSINSIINKIYRCEDDAIQQPRVKVVVIFSVLFLLVGMVIGAIFLSKQTAVINPSVPSPQPSQLQFKTMTLHFCPGQSSIDQPSCKNNKYCDANQSSHKEDNGKMKADILAIVNNQRLIDVLIVGSADKNELAGNCKNLFGSNNGLARARAESVIPWFTNGPEPLILTRVPKNNSTLPEETEADRSVIVRLLYEN